MKKLKWSLYYDKKGIYPGSQSDTTHDFQVIDEAVNAIETIQRTEKRIINERFKGVQSEIENINKARAATETRIDNLDALITASDELLNNRITDLNTRIDNHISNVDELYGILKKSVKVNTDSIGSVLIIVNEHQKNNALFIESANKRMQMFRYWIWGLIAAIVVLCFFLAF